MTRAADFYRPGSVVFLDYWKSYDLVLGFEAGARGWDWSVEVIACDASGVPLRGERPRRHSTEPDRADRVVCIA